MSTADEAGAFAFVRQYFSVLNAAVRSGDVAALRPLRQPGCSCLTMEQTITTVYENGGRVEGAELSVRQLLLGESGPAFAKVTAVFATSEGQTIDRTGRATRLSAVRGNQFVSLVRVGDHWVIDDIKTQTRS